MRQQWLWKFQNEKGLFSSVQNENSTHLHQDFFEEEYAHQQAMMELFSICLEAGQEELVQEEVDKLHNLWNKIENFLD